MLQKNKGNVKKILNFCFVISLSIAALLFFISSIMFSYECSLDNFEKVVKKFVSFYSITNVIGISLILLSFIFFEWNIFLDVGNSPPNKWLLSTITSSTLLFIGMVLFLVSQILALLNYIEYFFTGALWYTSIFFCLSLPCVISIILGFIFFLISNKKYAKWKIIIICILLPLLLFLPFVSYLLLAFHDFFFDYIPLVFDLFTYSLFLIIFLFNNIKENRYKIRCDKITLITIGIIYCLWIINLFCTIFRDGKTWVTSSTTSPYFILLLLSSFLFTAAVATYAVGNILNIKSKK